MTRVLFVGQQPETVDFTDPTLPPGVTAEKIHAGIALALKQMAERGWRGGPVFNFSLMKNSRARGGAEANKPGLRLCGDRRWHSPAAPTA